MYGLSGQQHQVLSFLLMFLRFQIIVSSSFQSSSSANLCSPEEKFALLNFKNSISINSSGSSHCDAAPPYSKTDSWKENTDCCSWDGITCDDFSGHVIGLDLSSSWLLGPLQANSSLFLLRHLQKLNLACNYFSGSEISSNFGRQFTELTHLNLASSFFSGTVPNEISQLSRLVSLDLSSELPRAKLEKPPRLLEQHSFNKLANNLTRLKYLLLDNVNMASVLPGSLLNLSSSLISLGLSNCQLKGEFPTDIFHYPFLRRLILSNNSLLSGKLPKSNWSSPLNILDLSETQFSGKLPATIGNLINLKVLDLSFDSFDGSIPNSIWNLTGITYLDLTNNFFSGQVSASSLGLSSNRFVGQFSSHASSLSHLNHLSLGGNFLNGTIPSWFFTLPSLQYLDLRGNKFTGNFDQFQFSNLNFTFEFSNLASLDLSSNNLSGTVKSYMFSKLKNLLFVDFSNNKLLSLTTTNNNNLNFTLPLLQVFIFSSCNVSQFPDFLRIAENLLLLDLSDNRITGEIFQLDHWPFLSSLDLSQNLLTSIESITPENLLYLDLHSNFLQRPPLILSSKLHFFSVSHNKLIGEFPSSFCKWSDIEYLDLSDNFLSGLIPQCLGNFSFLVFLDLRNNTFWGSIPQIFEKCADTLASLNLNGNQLEGTLSPSLGNCNSLEVLDVGNNRINDTFPYWITTLPELRVLVLRSNRFHGPIYKHSSLKIGFTNLRIMDLSRNRFTGLIPASYFQNFEAMRHEDDDDDDDDDIDEQYMKSPTYGQYYSMTLTYKGEDLDMERILNMLTTIDLSNNQFEGMIPIEVGNLSYLRLLNLSHNQLTGHIPSSMGNLTRLEALDLSSNKLVGGIPMEMTSMTSLSILNLSYNQLAGPIPQGNQLITFGNDSYIGNSGLCGLPLSQKCGNNHEAPSLPTTSPEECDDTWSCFDWKIVELGYVCGLVWGLSLGYLAFSTRKPQWLMKMFERFEAKKRRRLNRRQRN